MTDSRRIFLKKTLLGSLAASLIPTSSNTKTILNKKRSLRIAHITDVHIINKPLAIKCFEKVLREINSLKDKPDLIINTGDCIMDSNNQTKETVEGRWSLWKKIIKENNQIPIKSAIGNHDEWWGPGDLDKEYKNDKNYGKAWALESLNMPERFYSFEKNNWHFIALDSINRGEGYHLDEPQFIWLQNELNKIPAKNNICVFNHVPLISACSWLYETQRKESKDVKFPMWDMHIDNKKIKDLFVQHKNIMLALSGHVHYIDEVDYLGIKYLCNGAVSGNWWGEPIVLDEFPPLYTIIDLFEDGSIKYEKVFYDYKV